MEMSDAAGHTERDVDDCSLAYGNVGYVRTGTRAWSAHTHRRRETTGEICAHTDIGDLLCVFLELAVGHVRSDDRESAQFAEGNV